LWREKRLRKALAGRTVVPPIPGSVVSQINRGVEVY
jgi:hypothetical protein